MRYSLMLPLAFLGLAGCVQTGPAAAPAPITTTYVTPAPTATIVTAVPAGTYVTPSSTSTTTVVRTQ